MKKEKEKDYYCHSVLGVLVYLKKEQIEKMNQIIGCNRFYRNKLVEKNNEFLEKNEILKRETCENGLGCVEKEKCEKYKKCSRKSSEIKIENGYYFVSQKKNENLKERECLIYNFQKQIVEENDFLKETSSLCLQNVGKKIFITVRNCYKKNGNHSKMPRYQSRNKAKQSFEFPIQGIKIKGKRIFIKIPKIKEWVEVKLLSNFDEKTMEIKTIAIIREYVRQKRKKNDKEKKKCGYRYYVRLSVRIKKNIKQHKNPDSLIGIDSGQKNLIYDSDGNFVKSIFDEKAKKNNFNKNLKKIDDQIKNLEKQKDYKIFCNKKKEIQKRKLKPDHIFKKSNQKVYSKSYWKILEKIAKLKRKRANMNESFLHIISKKYTEDYETIAFGDLSVAKVTKSAKGTQEKHGENVKFKADLNRKMLEVSVGKLKWQLSYKTERLAGKYHEINEAFTSITCFKCGYVDEKNREKQEIFKCRKCGHQDHADFNAAKNIKKKFLKKRKIL